MKVIVSNDAERDLIDGIAFYDRNGTEIGNYFCRSLLADLQALTVLGGIHSKCFGYHCMPAKRFPFAIYYSLNDSTISVIAILDERRDPEWIEYRLKHG